MFTKKSHQDLKKSTVKIQDSKKDSATRLKHLKIILEHFDSDEAKTYFENNFSHVYFILYDNFIQAENNLRQKVHKAGKEELEAALLLLEKVLCLLPELLGKRWQLHSLTRIFSKLLHSANSQKLRAEAIKFFLLWYQALGDNAPFEVHKMFALLIPGMPDPGNVTRPSPLNPKPFDITTNPHETGDFSMEDIMQHPNFSTVIDNAKKVVVEQTSSGIMGKIANVSASIFHDTNALNPVQSVEIQPLLPPSANEKSVDNETKYFFEILLDGMATSVTKLQWRDRSHAKAMRCFAFLLEKFKQYYLPVICPQFNHKNSLYKPNLDLPVQHNILEDDFVLCRVTLIKWVANYAHFMKKQGSDGGQPSSMTSIGSHLPHSNTPTPATSLHHEEETSFTVGHPSDSSRASSHDSASNTPHPSLESGSGVYEELSSEQVVRDVLCCSSREHVDFTIEVLRQAFLLPFSHAAAIRRVIALYKDWIQMNVSEIPPFLMESTYEQQLAQGEPAVPPRRLRNDSYLGALGRDNVMVRAGMQNVLQVFMTQAAHVFVGSGWTVLPAGAASPQQLLDEQTDTCKRVLNIYRYMVMHVAMDYNTWEQLLLVLLQITSLVLTKIPPKKKQETLGGNLAPALFQTLIVTWIKANLNVAVKSELWQNFMELLMRLTHWEDLIKEWAKTMETLTRVLARHVYSLDLSEASGGSARGGRRPPAAPAVLPRPPALHHAVSVVSNTDTRTPGKSPKVNHETHPRKETATRRQLTRCRSDPHLSKQARVEEVIIVPTHRKPRRWYSLDSLRNSLSQNEERDSASGSRSPSPAPSSGVESSSIKDSPLQIDLVSDGANVSEWGSGDAETGGGACGVVLGGRARGWLPDVAAVMWRRMLAALGDPNLLRDPAHHAHFFNYLIHLNSTLLKCRGILIATERYKRLATCYLKTVHLFHHKNRSEHAMKIHVIVHRLSHYYTIYLISLVFVGMVLFNFMPIYNNINSRAFKSPRPENVTFQHAMYLALPFDYTTNIKGYFVVFILNWYISLVTTSHFCTFDLFISLMIIHLWGHIKILMCSLEDIEGFVPGGSFKFTIEQNRKINLILQECIRHHQFTIDFTNEMSSTFGLVILFYYFFYQVSGCLLLLACSQMDIESLSRFGPMTFILFQQLIQLSIVFELISSLSENLPNAVYNVLWEFMDKNNRKMVQVLLLQSQKLIQFKATSMMNVGVQAMATILKTSVSYFIMLRTMYQEH